MLPTGFKVPQETITRIWRTFTETGRIGAEDAALVDPAVVRSWRRCIVRANPLAEFRPAPINPTALASIVRGQQELITVATPFIEDIYQFTESSDYAIVLADGAGCILATGGDAHALGKAGALGFREGTYWSEGTACTNALGLVLQEATAVQIVGAEHYFRVLHGIVTAGAPIHDVRGRIIGVLGMVGSVETATSHTLALVMAAARAVGNQLQANWSLEEANQHLSEVNTIVGAITEGVIVWDQQGEIRQVNAQAGQMLQINARAAVGRALADVLALPGEVREAIDRKSVV